MSLLLMALLACSGSNAPAPRSKAFVMPEGPCSERLERAVLDASLKAGTRFLLTNQKPEGRFVYEYDYVNDRFTPDDNQVRQAGATWGLGLIYRDTGREDVRLALEKSLAFWETFSVRTEDGRRFVHYPGERRGMLGTVALVTLSIVEYLAKGGMPPEREAVLRTHLDEYLAFLLSMDDGTGRLPDGYHPVTGQVLKGFGPSPYSEGETLLALVEAARYTGHDELKPHIFRIAAAGHQANVVKALAEHPDSKTTKGYYQWSSMAYQQIATSGWPDTEEPYSSWAIEMADWMIDVHHTLSRNKNTAYAYEGITSAYDLALRKGDSAHEQKFGCVIDMGLEKLTSWQVGGPIPNKAISDRNVPADSRAIGGVQNHAVEPTLRIDVAQHQMHAVILAREFKFTK